MQSARFLACAQGPTIGPYERLERLSFRFCKVYFLTVDEVREPDRILQKLTLLLKDKQDAEKIIPNPKKQKPED